VTRKTLKPRPRLTREQQQAHTRATIIEVAAELFDQRGYQDVSLYTVAEYAGLTRGAIYANFADKMELFLAVQLARGTRTVAQHTDPDDEPPRTRRELIERQADSLARLYEDDLENMQRQEAARWELSSLLLREPDGVVAGDDARQIWFAAVSRMFARLDPGDVTASPAALAKGLIGVSFGIEQLALTSPSLLHPEDIRSMVRTVASTPGYHASANNDNETATVDDSRRPLPPLELVDQITERPIDPTGSGVLLLVPPGYGRLLNRVVEVVRDHYSPDTWIACVMNELSAKRTWASLLRATASFSVTTWPDFSVVIDPAANVASTLGLPAHEPIAVAVAAGHIVRTVTGAGLAEQLTS
jgi:AcrR family transcriptional regulator